MSKISKLSARTQELQTLTLEHITTFIPQANNGTYFAYFKINNINRQRNRGHPNMDSDRFFEKEYENLNNAILEAITGSKEVQNILARLREEENLDHMAVLNLFLSLDELFEMISDKRNNSVVYKLEPMEPKQSKEKEKTIDRPSSSERWKNKIDGKLLTQNETLFENYCQGKFNEKAWLKKARIRL